MNPSPLPASSPPWWRHGLVWMVIGGPAVVVVASIATFVIAARSPDPLVVHARYQRPVEVRQTAAPGSAKALLPAQQGRNHAASPDAAP